jgi:hypothetical protein
VCPAGDDWVACHDDQAQCYRLGIWYEDGIKVPRDPTRARQIFANLCDRFELGSCQQLCEAGDARRCVDLALLGISGAGGRPFPPKYEARDRAAFDKACQGGDDVACTMLKLDYRPGSQRTVQRVNVCFDDHARCFAAACDEADPLGCALLCHVGEALACEKLAALARRGTGFTQALPALAAGLARDGAIHGAPLTETAGAGQYDFERSEQPAGAIPRPPKPARRHVGEGLFSGWKTVHNIEGTSVGVTPLVTRSDTAASPSTDVSGLVGFFSEVYLRSWYPSDDKYLRFSLAGAIGGGSAGVDGQISHDAMAGFRFPFAATRRHNPYAGSKLVQSMSAQDRDALNRAIFSPSPHALFLRGGYALRYSAVGSLLSSAVEVPHLELGYHFDRGGDAGVGALELRGSAGLVLVGRFNVDDDRQPLGGALSWGGALVMHARRVHTQLGAQRILGAAFGARPAVHRIHTRACLRVVAEDERHYKYLLCPQALLEASPNAMAWQAGVFVGFDGLD